MGAPRAHGVHHVERAALGRLLQFRHRKACSRIFPRFMLLFSHNAQRTQKPRRRRLIIVISHRQRAASSGPSSRCF
jgi:hypothetical protein